MPKDSGQDKPQHFVFNVVVSGAGRQVTVNAHQTFEHVVKEALRESGNQGQPASEWELRTVDGTLIDQTARVGERGLPSGTTLFLTPRAGVGG